MAHDEWSSAGINFEYYPRQAANAFGESKSPFPRGEIAGAVADSMFRRSHLCPAVFLDVHPGGFSSARHPALL
jgi:hypothetical protein